MSKDTFVSHCVSRCGPLGITKTYLYKFDPLKPYFYIVKLGFTGVNINFLIFARKLRLWLLVRTSSPRDRLHIHTFLSGLFLYSIRRILKLTTKALMRLGMRDAPQKHAYIILFPFSKTGVYKDIYYFS